MHSQIHYNKLCVFFWQCPKADCFSSAVVQRASFIIYFTFLIKIIAHICIGMTRSELLKAISYWNTNNFVKFLLAPPQNILQIHLFDEDPKTGFDTRSFHNSTPWLPEHLLERVLKSCHTRMSYLGRTKLTFFCKDGIVRELNPSNHWHFTSCRP